MKMFHCQGAVIGERNDENILVLEISIINTVHNFHKAQKSGCVSVLHDSLYGLIPDH